MVEGVKTVHELKNSSFEVDSIYCTETLGFLENLEPELVNIIKEKELERISGVRNPNKVLAVAKIPY